MMTPNEALRAVEREEMTADDAATGLFEYRNFREQTKTGPDALIRNIDVALDKLSEAIDAELRQEGRAMRQHTPEGTTYKAHRDRLREALKPFASMSPYDCPYCEDHGLPVGAEHNCNEVPAAREALAATEDA